MHPVDPSHAYTHDEVVDNFDALLGQMDFQSELTLLGVGRMRFTLRREMKAEWQGLTIGLWRLALERSFPHDGEAIFETFLVRKVEELADTQKAELFLLRAREYATRLLHKGDANFTETSEHLLSLVDRTEAKAMRLRITLHIRNLYTLIFDRLI